MEVTVALRARLCLVIHTHLPPGVHRVRMEWSRDDMSPCASPVSSPGGDDAEFLKHFGTMMGIESPLADVMSLRHHFENCMVLDEHWALVCRLMERDYKHRKVMATAIEDGRIQGRREAEAGVDQKIHEGVAAGLRESMAKVDELEVALSREQARSQNALQQSQAEAAELAAELEKCKRQIETTARGDMGGKHRISPDGKHFEECIREVLERIEPAGTLQPHRPHAGDAVIKDVVIDAKSANEQQRHRGLDGDSSQNVPKLASDMLATGRPLGILIAQHEFIKYKSYKYHHMDAVTVDGRTIVLVPNVTNRDQLENVLVQALRQVRRALHGTTLTPGHLKSQIVSTIGVVKNIFSTITSECHRAHLYLSYHETLLRAYESKERSIEIRPIVYGKKFEPCMRAIDELRRAWSSQLLSSTSLLDRGVKRKAFDPCLQPEKYTDREIIDLSDLGRV